jgi:2-iminobutanoate/2-iminopropanoate deaminase
MPTPNSPSHPRSVNLPGRRTALPFSDGVLAGGTLYLSGRIGIDPATGSAPREVQRELEYLFAGFESVLAQAGMTMDDLVSVQIFSPDLSLWEQFNAEYVKHFSGELPARAFIGSGPLLLGGRFEMMGVAVRRAS